MTFRKGVSGSPRGRPRIVADIRDLCRKFGAEGVELLADIARDRDQPGRARVEAIKELFARGYGRVVSSTDVMFLMNERKADRGEVVVHVGFVKSDEGVPLHKFAETVSQPGLAKPALEDLRVSRVATRKEELERALAENEREIARLRRIEAERTPWTEAGSRWPMDRPPSGSDWPGRTS